MIDSISDRDGKFSAIQTPSKELAYQCSLVLLPYSSSSVLFALVYFLFII